MNNVFTKTRELGEALLACDEYKTMKAAEDAAAANEQAAQAMGAYLERKQKVQDLLIDEKPDSQALRTLSDEMDALQAQLSEIPEIQKLTEAREQFSNLIEQVNKVLRFIITGDMDDEEESGGCGGSCATCGGCHTLH